MKKNQRMIGILCKRGDQIRENELDEEMEDEEKWRNDTLNIGKELKDIDDEAEMQYQLD